MTFHLTHNKIPNRALTCKACVIWLLPDSSNLSPYVCSSLISSSTFPDCWSHEPCLYNLFFQNIYYSFCHRKYSSCRSPISCSSCNLCLFLDARSRNLQWSCGWNSPFHTNFYVHTLPYSSCHLSLPDIIYNAYLLYMCYMYLFTRM